MQQRRLGTFSISAIGLGCMNLSHAYGVPPTPEYAERLLLRALDLGVTHFDTAALYGFDRNEELVGKVLSAHRSRFTLASKCGMTGVPDEKGVKRRVIDGRPDTLKRTCEAALKRLNTEVIDLYYLHRWDKSVPIEDSVGALADLVGEGKIRSIGLSEVSAATLRRAHAVHPIAAMQSEYSLWAREAEIAVLDACRELGVRFVAFSPLGRGFLSATIDSTAAMAALPANDIRHTMPRFQSPNLEANFGWLRTYRELAQEAGCTPAQLALAWLLHRDPDLIVLPGTSNIAHLEENIAAADVQLDAELVRRVDQLVNNRTVTGPRYNAQSQIEVDTEQF